MKKSAFCLAACILAISACSDGENKSKEGAPLYENPPFGASDIDSTVEETRRRMAPPPSNHSAPDQQQQMEQSSENTN